MLSIHLDFGCFGQVQKIQAESLGWAFGCRQLGDPLLPWKKTTLYNLILAGMLQAGKQRA
jgi:hypothetical protein